MDFRACQRCVFVELSGGGNVGSHGGWVMGCCLVGWCLGGGEDGYGRVLGEREGGEDQKKKKERPQI